jgi:NAD(P)-dependent dehydrogenase (short-subunit alcohol dehydrogenase family)
MLLGHAPARILLADMSESISKAVLITGCSTGIGRATAQRLAAKGWTVYATARRAEAIADLESAGCRTLSLDVTDEPSMKAAVDAIEAEHGAVGVLVNNAGYSQSGAVESVSMEDVRRQFETNVFGLVRLTQLALPGMRRQGWGKVVNVSSMGANFVFPGGGYYHATKFAVDAISDALRFEVKGFGVDVMIIQPGLIKTEFGNAAADSLDEADRDGGAYGAFNAAVGDATKNAYESGPLGKLGGGPETVAKAIEKAITARRPKARYRVTASAHLLINQRKLMTDRMWDAMVRTQFPQPKP